MHTTRRFRHAAVAATLALTATLTYTENVSAKPAHMIKHALALGSISQGKSLVSQYRCTGCHGANLAGRQGFSPSIKRTGALHDYTQAQFIKLMHTGITNDGTHVRKPMPVYTKMPTPQAISIFAYLRSLK